MKLEELKVGMEVDVKPADYHFLEKGPFKVVTIYGNEANCEISGFNKEHSFITQTIHLKDIVPLRGSNFDIKKIYSNEAKRTVAVLFKDGDKRVVHCSENDEFDVYVGVALAVARKVYGSSEKFHKLVEKKGK